MFPALSSDDKAALSEWYDVLQDLRSFWREAQGLLQARHCAHKDAQWLSSLFPVALDRRSELVSTLKAQGDDPRALFLSGDRVERARAAAMGYAPAQAELALRLEEEGRGKGLEWAEKAAAQSDRDALFLCAECYREGFGCKEDLEKARVFCEEAAELGQAEAMFHLGLVANQPAHLASAIENIADSVHVPGAAAHFSHVAAAHQPQEAALPDCPGHGDTPAPASHVGCDSCTACQACHTVALSPAAVSAVQLAGAVAPPHSPVARFASADTAPGHKPPIS